ncbi:MAG TPA: universal stress protein [Bacteroidales bacterium]|nr:universal stress protein [Bacteroidales bacterium]
MYKHILVAYDGSEGAKTALNNSLAFAKAMKAKLTALWIGGYRAYYHETVAEIDEESKAIDSFSAKLKKDLHNISKSEGIEIEYAHLQGNPAKLIVEYAEKNHVDLIVMGCKGHSGLWGNDLGHVTDKVSENAKCNVLIARK